MKFIVIGASGYIGSHCYNHLKSQGYTVMGTQHTSTSLQHITFDLSQDRIHNVIESSFFTKTEKIYSIVFAAFSQVERCFQEKEKSYRVNVTGTIQLLNDLGALGSTPIYISTSAVYDGVTGNYNEESVRHPQTEYGRQKLEVEKYIEKNFPQAIIVRIDKALDDQPAHRNPLNEWYNLIKQNKPILCLDQTFSPTDVQDIAHAILILCRKNLQGTYNLANPEFFSRRDLAQQFAQALGETCEIQMKTQQELNFKEPRPQKSYLNSTKFINATNYKFTPMTKVFSRFKDNVQS